MSHRTWCLPVKQTQVWSLLCRASTFLISTSSKEHQILQTEWPRQCVHLLSNNYNRIKPLPTKSARNYSHIIHSIRRRMFLTIIWEQQFYDMIIWKWGNLKKRKSGIPVRNFVVKSGERVFKRFWHVSKTTWGMSIRTRDLSL